MTSFHVTLGLRWTRACGLLLALSVLAAPGAKAQEGSSIPDEYRGTEAAYARGILDGNLIETNFRNHGEFARWDDHPHGVYPRSIGGRHIDGIGVVVLGRVYGERIKWGLAPRDTILNPVSINYRGAGKRTGPYGDLWGWAALPGFHNPRRRDPVTQTLLPTPALSDDSTSWPTFWPDRLDEEDSGWRGDDIDNNPSVAAWNGMFGKGVFQADLEAYYVMDDLTDREYHVDSITGRPFSSFGVFYPDPTDSTKGGLGLQVAVRALQWANILAEDAAFLIYRITNVGKTDYGAPLMNGENSGLYFAQIVDYGLGNEEDDESAAFDPLLDVVYGWDLTGRGDYPSGSTYQLYYTGFAFLESPAEPDDSRDNDQDGLTDEQRFSGPGIRIEGQENIRAALLAQPGFDMDLFEAAYDSLETRPAYLRGVWWTGDENLDWQGYTDQNENGQYDQGELVNSDYGRDGLGPFDLDYPGPDVGESDGIPTIREPNFDETDVQESDQIGLTGFELSTRPIWETDQTLRNDTWMWAKFRDSQFPLGQEPQPALLARVEPFIAFSSGPVSLGANQTDFFSTAWIFGNDEQDFFDNLSTVQRIYNADYQFAQPPIPPTLKAMAGDGRVVLSWDTLSLASYDRFTQREDFEGYRLYKGTDPLLSDAKVITDSRGNATIFKPLRQWDLKNDITGNMPILRNTAFYNLGGDTGLEFSYIDTDVVNGKTYYYALVAYDYTPPPDGSDPNEQTIDPQENTFNIAVDQGGNVRGFSQNVAIVTPRSRAAGWEEAGAVEDLSEATGNNTRPDGQAQGSGRIAVSIVDQESIDPNTVYELQFFHEEIGNDRYETAEYLIRSVTEDTVLVPRRPIEPKTPTVDGFQVTITNHETEFNPAESGWIGTGDAGGVLYENNPAELTGFTTDWIVNIEPDLGGRYYLTADEFEVRWEDSTYITPIRGGFLRQKPINFWCHNVTENSACQIFVTDGNGNGEVDYLTDTLIVAQGTATVPRLHYKLTFDSPSGDTLGTPSPGDAIRIYSDRPFATGDFFQFTLREGETDAALAQSELDRINVVPNPYIVASDFEPRTQISGRGERRVTFINLPAQCTIKIYTVRGEHVRTIEHNDASGGGNEVWNLRTDGNQEVAYGIYFYHVEAPGIGDKTGKLAIIK